LLDSLANKGTNLDLSFKTSGPFASSRIVTRFNAPAVSGSYRSACLHSKTLQHLIHGLLQRDGARYAYRLTDKWVVASLPALTTFRCLTDVGESIPAFDSEETLVVAAVSDWCS